MTTKSRIRGDLQRGILTDDDVIHRKESDAIHLTGETPTEGATILVGNRELQNDEEIARNHPEDVSRLERESVTHREIVSVNLQKEKDRVHHAEIGGHHQHRITRRKKILSIEIRHRLLNARVRSGSLHRAKMIHLHQQRESESLTIPMTSDVSTSQKLLDSLQLPVIKSL